MISTITNQITGALPIYKEGGKSPSKITIKKSHEGRFTEWCRGKVTRDCIRRGKASSDPKVRKQAVFAENARKWKHDEGGVVKAAFGTSLDFGGYFDNGNALGTRTDRMKKEAQYAQALLEEQKQKDNPIEFEMLETNAPVATSTTKKERPEEPTSSIYDYKIKAGADDVDPTVASGLDATGVDFSRMNSKDLGDNYVLTHESKHKCTSGPETWLKEMAGYDVQDYGGWWSTPYSNSTTEANFIKNDPTHWKLVYHSTGDKAGDFADMQVGDVALSFANKKDGSPTSHA